MFVNRWRLEDCQSKETKIKLKAISIKLQRLTQAQDFLGFCEITIELEYWNSGAKSSSIPERIFLGSGIVSFSCQTEEKLKQGTNIIDAYFSRLP